TVEMGGCKLLPRSGLSETTWAVVENSSDDISRRFFYIKTDNAHFEVLINNENEATGGGN
ncbi:MAG: hypothetical protein K0B09_14710, partial [Bacteroidales bacterium]|nr:hypothetical protein [Bacteroidales bacterium]